MWGLGKKEKSEEEELEELKAMMKSPPKREWDNTPLRNPPAALRGMVPVTKEPWMDRAKEDAKWSWQKDEKDKPQWRGEKNGLVEEAKYRRQARNMARPWNSTSVRHAPHVLRGQKTIREEPWSQFHNDDISELNAIEGVSINELYASTADRGTPKNPTIVQPEWNTKGPWSR